MKSIPLSALKPRRDGSTPVGLVALIDDEDYERVSTRTWCAWRNKTSKTWYARSGGLFLHRFVMDAPTKTEVDHADRNGLNCQKINLRLATSSQNKANTPARGRSGLKGVRLHAGRWEASIRIDGDKAYLGRFDTALEASLVYDAKAREVYGEFAYLNNY